MANTLEELKPEDLRQLAERYRELADSEDVLDTGLSEMLVGLAGNDTLKAGEDAGVLRGSSCNDDLRGGSEADLLDADDGRDIGAGGRGNDVLLGGNGRDILGGNSGADRVFGGRGNETLLGGSGNNTLSGNRGADKLVGGPGQNVLSGGKGVDTFEFVRKSGDDRITDFEIGTDSLMFTGVRPDRITVSQQNGETYLRYFGNTLILRDIETTRSELAFDPA